MFIKTRSVVRKFGRQLGLSGVAVGLSVVATQASATAAAAALEIESAGADVSTIGWASLGLLIVAAAFKYMRRTV